MSVRSKYGNGQGSGGNWDEGTSYTSELVGDSQVGSTENGPRDQFYLWLCVMEPRPIHTAASHLWLCVMEPMPIHTAASPCIAKAKLCYGHLGSRKLSF